MSPVRCEHCGLQHEGRVRICPTTGLRIEARVQQAARRRARAQRTFQRAPQSLVGVMVGGKYRVTRLIGHGGMSAIYQADDLTLRRHVALKVLHPGLADDEEAIARLRREAQVVSAIGHPHICQVFDLGFTAEGCPYLVLERLIGESLAEHIARSGPMSFSELAPLILQVLAALQAAHQKGILHRDLKPDNVFVVDTGARGAPLAKLLDFGISKSMAYELGDQQRLTHTGMVMGTPYYMAPEQARGDSTLDYRVDLWAVGIILYEALSGRRPFVATNYNALLVKILTSKPRSVQRLVPTVPAPVAELVERAMAKPREDRFQSAEQFARAVQWVRQRQAPDDLHAPTVAIRRPGELPLPCATEPDGLPSALRSGAPHAQETEPMAHNRLTESDAETGGLETDGEPEIAAYAYFHATNGAVAGASTERTEVMRGWDDEPGSADSYADEPDSETLADTFSDTDVVVGGAQRAGEATATNASGASARRDEAASSKASVGGDDEPTTVYDVDAARAKLAARRRQRLGRTDDGSDRSGGRGGRER